MGDEEVATAYANQLMDLKINSKPVINVLTMMAEDYIQKAPIVVQSIEKHLNKVHPGVKLPALYLIDSIVKNVKKDYTNLFTQNIVSTFCGVFEKVRVDDRVKLQMFKLRQTWNDVFPQRKLYAIDVRCHQHDKNWPISAAPPSNTASIHVNPKFLNTARTPTPGPTGETVAVPEPPETMEVVQPPVGDVAESQMREKLLLKKKELLELQQKKIELELMQTKAALETKRLVEIESAMNREKLLLQQAEMAKSKTDIANHILSSYPTSIASSSAIVNQPTSSSSSAVTTTVVHDPRLIRQMENKARAEDAVHKTRVSRVEASRTVKSKVSIPEKPIRPSYESTVTTTRAITPMDSISTLITPEVEDTHPHKIEHDVVEIDMFGSPRNSKDNKRGANKDRKGGRGTESEKKSSSKERSSRDRSRSSERSRSSSSSKGKKHKDKERKKEVKVESRESEDDYEDEMKGYSGLTIKPKRSDIEMIKRSPNKEIPGPSNKSNLHKEKRILSPFHSSRTGSPSEKSSRGGTPGMSQSTIASSSQSSLGDDSSSRSLESPSKSPQKRSRSSSERSDKEKKEKDTKHVRKSEKKEYKGRTRYEEKRSPPKHGAKIHQEKDVSVIKIYDNYDERQKAVLKRNYRKSTGIETEEEENKVPPQQLLSQGSAGESGSGDVDLRFQGLQDIDLRKEADGQGEPPSKKTRSGGSASNIIDDLFGREDVDLRQPRSGSWSQMKKPGSGGRHRRGSSQEHDEDIREILQQQDRNRPPPGVSPAHSTCSGRSSCDPLGRPLLYDKLPDDPEERKRSLDTRSHSIDPVEQFRIEYIDRVLNAKGELSQMDVKNILAKAQDHHNQGIFNSDQYMSLMKRITQINEASAIREVQQMQMRGTNWQSPEIANPWTVASGPPQGPWPTRNFQPRGPLDIPRFPPSGPSNAWGPQPMNMGAPWNNQLPRPSGPNPFEEALIPRIDDLIPGVNEMELRAAEMDTANSIPIDKVMRQLRFYGETAVVLMGMMADEPKEISFQRDGRTRTVLINGKPMELTIGELKFFELNRTKHTLKIGAPTRELYIDDRCYEVCFNGPSVRIHIDNRMHSFQLTGPPPQVEVGKVLRYDLLAGRVNLNIDAAEKFAVYLDEKPQKLDLFAEPVILRFCDNFRKVLLNGRPFPTNFGARLPFSVTIPGAGQHYFRFLAVPPATEHAIMEFIRFKTQGGRMQLEDGANHENFGLFRGRGRGGIRGRGGRGGPPVGPRGRENFEQGMAPVLDRNPLDMLTNLFPSPNMGDSVDERKRKLGDKAHSYESDINKQGETEAVPTEESNGGAPDVDSILALARTLGFNFEMPSISTSSEVEETGSPPQEEKPKLEVTEEKVEEEPKKPKVPPLETVNVTFNDNLKERRSILVAQLWTGVQCASCGLRFPPDQTVRYSQHLDWHFRFNRREKGNHKKAQSRKWYYDLSDWIQFEEVEDLEERAASMFEIPEESDGTPKSPNAVSNQEECTVLASGHEGAACPQCGETFDSFFDEEQEEWRLRNAVLDENETDEEKKVYHPTCHQDYLKSLVEESIMEVDSECVTDLREDDKEETGDNAAAKAQEEEEEDDEVLILKEGKKEIVLMEIDVDLDDDEMLGKNSKETKVENNEGDSLNAEKKNEFESTEMSKGENSVQTAVFSHSIYSKSIQSPIMINDDSSSNLLPGISDDSAGGVFGFALNSGILSERSDSPTFVDEKKIVYERMKFDFPKIKIEPVDDEVPAETEAQPISDSFLNSQEELVERESEAHEDVIMPSQEPVNIDLTDDNSMDEVDGPTRPVGQMTAIDGNLQPDEGVSIPFIPPTKIRIKISGVDVAASKSPKSKPGGDSPAPDTLNAALGSPSNKGGKSPDSVNSNSVENKKNLDVVITEEMKRLKPRLVGRKLVNCPPKQVGKEESGLCVIC